MDTQTHDQLANQAHRQNWLPRPLLKTENRNNKMKRIIIIIMKKDSKEMGIENWNKHEENEWLKWRVMERGSQGLISKQTKKRSIQVRYSTSQPPNITIFIFVDACSDLLLFWPSKMIIKKKWKQENDYFPVVCCCCCRYRCCWWFLWRTRQASCSLDGHFNDLK